MKLKETMMIHNIIRRMNVKFSWAALANAKQLSVVLLILVFVMGFYVSQLAGESIKVNDELKKRIEENKSKCGDSPLKPLLENPNLILVKYEFNGNFRTSPIEMDFPDGLSLTNGQLLTVEQQFLKPPETIASYTFVNEDNKEQEYSYTLTASHTQSESWSNTNSIEASFTVGLETEAKCVFGGSKIQASFTAGYGHSWEHLKTDEKSIEYSADLKPKLDPNSSMQVSFMVQELNDIEVPYHFDIICTGKGTAYFRPMCPKDNEYVFAEILDSNKKIFIQYHYNPEMIKDYMFNNIVIPGLTNRPRVERMCKYTVPGKDTGLTAMDLMNIRNKAVYIRFNKNGLPIKGIQLPESVFMFKDPYIMNEQGNRIYPSSGFGSNKKTIEIKNDTLYRLPGELFDYRMRPLHQTEPDIRVIFERDDRIIEFDIEQAFPDDNIRTFGINGKWTGVSAFNGVTVYGPCEPLSGAPKTAKAGLAPRDSGLQHTESPVSLAKLQNHLLSKLDAKELALSLDEETIKRITKRLEEKQKQSKKFVGMIIPLKGKIKTGK
jgi:hypothetical protein